MLGFISGTNCLKKAVKMLRMTKGSDVLTHQQPRENIDKIKDIVINNHQIIIREVTEEVGIFLWLMRNNFGYKTVKFVPKLLHFHCKKLAE